MCFRVFGRWKTTQQCWVWCLAFVTAKIVGTAQITPAGLGPVEAAMTGSLVAVGMTASSAFGVVFVYRIIPLH